MEKSQLKKAIIFDLDGVLWQGVFGEEGTIEVNTHVVETLKVLAMRGVIVGLCSKNDADMLDSMIKDKLGLEHYLSVQRINWCDKVLNLCEIAAELNIGLDAMVFVDDSEFERGLVKDQLPEVLTISPGDLLLTVVACFDLSGDITKTAQYKANRQREQLKVQTTNMEEYLTKLDMVLSIKLNDVSHVERIAELTQKTNQFNLTTRRYTPEQIRVMMSPEMGIDYVYSLSVKDVFGDNGLVGVCIIQGSRLDVFLLSCRVLGRNIERAFIDYIIKDQLRHDTKGLIAQYIMTQKNKQTQHFYADVGFECIDVKEDVTTFALVLENYKSVLPTYFRYE